MPPPALPVPARPGAFYAVTRAAARAVARAAFGLKVRGGEHVPASGACILAANHASYLDAVILGCASPRVLRFVAEAEIFYYRWSAAVLARLGAFPLRRGAPDRGAIRTALDCLHRGEALAVFPEGGRASGDGVGPLFPGVGLLAAISGAPVVPSGIRGTRQAWPRDRRLPRRALVAVTFGSPLSFAEVTGARGGPSARARFCEHLRASMEALLVPPC